MNNPTKSWRNNHPTRSFWIAAAVAFITAITTITIHACEDTEHSEYQMRHKMLEHNLHSQLMERRRIFQPTEHAMRPNPPITQHILNKENTPMVKGKWICRNQGAVVVKAWAYTTPHKNAVPFAAAPVDAKIESDGLVLNAIYERQGLSHVWYFGFDKSERSYKYRFVIEPNGKGWYFTEKNPGESRRAPGVIAHCRKL